MGTLTNLNDVKRSLALGSNVSGTLTYDKNLDDSMITSIIQEASDWFSNETAMNYYGATGTLTLDATGDFVHGPTLFFRDDLAMGITRIENDGNGTLTSADWVTLPRNSTPYYGVRLKTKTWRWTTSRLGAIKVIGTIGGAIDGQPPERVHLAVTRLASWLYQTRDTRGSVHFADRTVSFGDTPDIVQRIADKERRSKLYT